MTIKKSQLGLEVFFSALVLGIAGESLLFNAGWGLGATLWVAGVTAAGIFLISRWDDMPSRFDQWLLVPLGLLALCYGWRDAWLLKFVTTVGLVSILGLNIQARQIAKMQNSTPKIPGIFSTGIRLFFGYPKFLRREVKWNMLFSGIDDGTLKSVGRALIIAVPSLLVFGMLLSSADAEFGSLLSGFIAIDIIALPSRILLIGILVLVVGVYFRGLATQVVPSETAGKKTSSKELLMLEVGIVLGLVNLMFATFVFMQLGYLFGGAAYIEAAANVTLSQYARGGFFELITVASIALFLIMWLRKYFKPASTAHESLFSMLAGIQIALLLVMLVSAGQRMWLYTASFGLTELRLYTSAFMAWLAFVLVWFVWTALIGKALKFVRGAVLAGAVVVFGLHIINPEGLIARTNIKRAIQGAGLDHHYLSTLSFDATPIILEMLPDLPDAERIKLSSMMGDKFKSTPESDWRSWNISQYRAINKLQKVYDPHSIGQFMK